MVERCKSLMIDLINNVKAGAYASAVDGSVPAVKIFSWANTPQWQSVDAYVTEKLGIPDVAADRISMTDNQEIGLRGEDIWDDVFQEEG